MLAHLPVTIALALVLAVLSGSAGAAVLPVADSCSFVCPGTIEKYGQTYDLTLQRNEGGRHTMRLRRPPHRRELSVLRIRQHQR
ncbi:hypothetical protein C8R47DRAFT_1170811 [Mycena vitilis]|nr:hypothetical protein C8R47DRAFT_1170811 [Mycena vitilis]